MKAPALAETAVDLPWLAPGAGSLAALVRLPAAEAWLAVRGDPGLVLLWARFGSGQRSVVSGRSVPPPPTGHWPPATAIAPAFAPHSLQHAQLLEEALRLLQQPAFADWTHPDLAPVYRTCYAQAALAHSLASRVAGCNPDCAWMGGLLAPLGWLAAGAVDPQAVPACLAHPDFGRCPAAAQHQCWGLDHTAIARRLCRRWSLPPWLGAIIGQLGLPASIAERLGADPCLLQVVQLAVGLIQQEDAGLGLLVGTAPDELLGGLALDRQTVLEHLDRTRRAADEACRSGSWLPPAQTPLLADYLRLAASHGRFDGYRLESLQTEVDQLHLALQEQCAAETGRLHELKLRALAELAAGAGHEINNPLAVISGQAQYLMGSDEDPARCKALQTIVAQTRRIHEILTGLMQFARPRPPKKEIVALADLVRDAIEAVQAHADHAQVQLIADGRWQMADFKLPLEKPETTSQSAICHLPSAIHLEVDRGQIRTALVALLRNGIEAAPPQGWVKLCVRENGAGVDLIVEDNGAGPPASAGEHLFDPFYSGKSAGRGRGLGLATAWRLAQLNGGLLAFAGHSHGVTRFALHLPLTAVPASLPPQVCHSQIVVAA